MPPPFRALCPLAEKITADLGCEDAIKKHKKTYVDDDDDKADARSLGTAAAMQALKMFNQGETGGKQSKGALLGLALSEASKVGPDCSIIISVLEFG